MPSPRTGPDEAVFRMIRDATQLYDRFGAEMIADPGIRALLVAYGSAIDRSGARMRDVGVVETCTDCAMRGPGSCCFPGIEEGYDPVLLLINRLMGCPLPDDREVSSSCFFVGSEGCKLKARYYFCLHYLCPRLENLLGTAGAHDLLATIGEELAAGWNLERTLRRWLAPHAEGTG
jgi:hypothetical protein